MMFEYFAYTPNAPVCTLFAKNRARKLYSPKLNTKKSKQDKNLEEKKPCLVDILSIENVPKKRIN